MRVLNTPWKLNRTLTRARFVITVSRICQRESCAIDKREMRNFSSGGNQKEGERKEEGIRQSHESQNRTVTGDIRIVQFASLNLQWKEEKVTDTAFDTYTLCSDVYDISKVIRNARPCTQLVSETARSIDHSRYALHSILNINAKALPVLLVYMICVNLLVIGFVSRNSVYYYEERRKIGWSNVQIQARMERVDKRSTFVRL